MLTFHHVFDVCGVLEDLGQAVQEHGGLAVAIGYVLRLLEHLIESCWLNLEHAHDRISLTSTKSICTIGLSLHTHETHQLHCVIVDELLCGDAVDFVHKALLIREEVVEFVGQLPAQGDAAFVALIQTLDHWEDKGRAFIKLIKIKYKGKRQRGSRNVLTLFDGSGRVELGRFNLSFGQMERGSKELSCLHVKHQLLHLPVGGSTTTARKTNGKCLQTKGPMITWY